MDHDDRIVGTCHSMAASRSTRVTRSTVGLNGLDESFCGRTLRNRSIAHPEEISSNSQVRSRSPKKRPEPVPIQKGNNNGRTTDLKQQSTRESWMRSSSCRKTSSGLPLILHYGELYNSFIIYYNVIIIEIKCTINVMHLYHP